MSARVKIDIYNSLGNKITTFVDEFHEAGEHRTKFTIGAIQELPLQSGLYYLRIQLGETLKSEKIILIR